MATDITEIQMYLDELGMDYTPCPAHDRAWLDVPSRGYLDPGGEKHYSLLVELREKGQLLNMFVPMLYRYRGAHLDALLAAVVTIQLEVKLGRYAVKSEEGEVCFGATLALEDGALTRKMLSRMIHAICWTVEYYDGALRTAMQSGRVEMPPPVSKNTLEPGGSRVVH